MREGDDVTIVALGRMVLLAQSGGGAAADRGDRVRDRRPAHHVAARRWTSILESVETTGRLVVVDESHPRCGMAVDIAARVAEQAFASLQTAPSLVTPPHSPVPFSPVLEDAYVPTAETIMDAVRTTVGAEAQEVSATAQKLGMPKWGLSMTEGRVLEWLVDEGAEVHPGDEVAEIETDKLTGPVESPLEGVLRRRVAAEGDVVPVGGLLGVVADPEVPDAEIDAFVADFQASFVPGESEEDAGPAPETVEVAAGTLRFLRQGDGEPVVFLHGFGGDLEQWQLALPALADSHTAIALDLPGHGGSTKDVGSGDLVRPRSSSSSTRSRWGPRTSSGTRWAAW